MDYHLQIPSDPFQPNDGDISILLEERDSDLRHDFNTQKNEVIKKKQLLIPERAVQLQFIDKVASYKSEPSTERPDDTALRPSVSSSSTPLIVTQEELAMVNYIRPSLERIGYTVFNI